MTTTSHRGSPLMVRRIGKLAFSRRRRQGEADAEEAGRAVDGLGACGPPGPRTPLVGLPFFGGVLAMRTPGWSGCGSRIALPFTRDRL